ATTSLPACPVCGSSPHAWGTHELYGPRWQRKRFIPTCVGNTPSGGGGHPHESGSSPHAWGTPTAALAEPTGYRFIPTCVGNTKLLNTIYGIISVHPHMRGEHTRLLPPLALTGGSSPHAWGTHSQWCRWTLQNRFIPTCVGNTINR